MNLQENIKKEFDAAKDKVQFLNDLRKYISSLSPEKVNPVDCVLWVDKDMVVANNYNPNHVADKEMRLLYTSVREDGYTMPIVVLDKDIDQRMASTVRHNRARGSHSVDGMVNIVFNMLRDGVSEREICEKVGLEQKELVKLKYVTGFAKIFKSYKYNAAIEKVVDERRVARETAKKKEDKK